MYLSQLPAVFLMSGTAARPRIQIARQSTKSHECDRDCGPNHDAASGDPHHAELQRREKECFEAF